MDPLSVPPMVMPSAWSTVAFLAVVIALAIAFVAAVRRSGQARGDTPATVSRHTTFAAAGIAAWLTLHAGVAKSGVLMTAALPPPTMIYLVATLVFVAGLALSRVGSRLATHLPIAALVGFQAFRIPLELVLHQWYAEGVLPEQMTYVGSNFDILSGIGGAVVGYLAYKGKAGVGLIWAYNLVGLLLLVIVVTIAVMSSPLPVRQFWNEPAVQLPLHAPYSWIVSICVAGALFGHLVTLRWLLANSDVS